MARMLNYAEARQYAIVSIRDFLEGTGGKWDWDDFTSIPTGFPDIEALQNFCAFLSVTHPHPVDYCNEEGFKLMRQKLEDLERDSFPPRTSHTD
jgi:hypothetical protein